MSASAETLRQYLQGREENFPHQLIEHFPHIVTRLVELWPDPNEARSYFKALLLTDRPGRQGFPPDAYFELFALSNVYEELQLSGSISEEK